MRPFTFSLYGCTAVQEDRTCTSSHIDVRKDVCWRNRHVARSSMCTLKDVSIVSVAYITFFFCISRIYCIYFAIFHAHNSSHNSASKTHAVHSWPAYILLLLAYGVEAHHPRLVCCTCYAMCLTVVDVEVVGYSWQTALGIYIGSIERWQLARQRKQYHTVGRVAHGHGRNNQ